MTERATNALLLEVLDELKEINDKLTYINPDGQEVEFRAGKVFTERVINNPDVKII